MTTKAITGGFAVCQTRLGAKVHDPKDPGADLGPMFSQVVSTILRLTERHADRWMGVQASHDIPVYGFERIIDPPPLQVNTQRLLEEFAKGRVTVGEEWAVALAPEQRAAVERLSAEAGDAVEDATRADTPTTVEDAHFHFPDETWARVIYDCVVAARSGALAIESLVASLIPLYFGRVASLIIETRELTTDRVEAFVERQARAFELAKPYLLQRWEASSKPPASGNGRRRSAVPAANAAAGGATRTRKANAAAGDAGPTRRRDGRSGPTGPQAERPTADPAAGPAPDPRRS
jgi:hypothetical protein